MHCAALTVTATPPWQRAGLGRIPRSGRASPPVIRARQWSSRPAPRNCRPRRSRGRRPKPGWNWSGGRRRSPSAASGAGETDSGDDDLRQRPQRPPEPDRGPVMGEAVPPVPDNDLRENHGECQVGSGPASQYQGMAWQPLIGPRKEPGRVRCPAGCGSWSREPAAGSRPAR
jgi:hypothetical protein